LLERCEEALTVLGSFEKVDIGLIREVLNTITSGQELDLTRFAGASKERILALKKDAELDDYTYRVAGCVGEFWTKMCRAHLFPRAGIDEGVLLKNGVRFGKGLQLVNILRDLPADLRQGRCYVPSERLAGIGLNPEDLLESKNEMKFRPLYDEYLGLAESHLTAGWAYTNMLPKGCVRVRLACAWPILIGMQTIAKLKTGNVLDPAQRIKISRPEVKKLMVRSVLAYPWPPAWKRLFPAVN
jgi:farnesyl-diphosphate farnesyltransferase